MTCKSPIVIRIWGGLNTWVRINTFLNVEHVYYSALQMDDSSFEQRWQFCCLSFHQQEKFTCIKWNLSRMWYRLAKGTFAANRQQLQNTSLTGRQVQGSKHPLRQCPNEKRMQHATLGLFNFLTLITVFTLFDSSKLSTFHFGRRPLPCLTNCTSREGITEALLVSFLCELFPMITCKCLQR